jgi:hypothetical protein
MTRDESGKDYGPKLGCDSQLKLDLGDCVTATPVSAVDQYLQREDALATLKELAYALGVLRAAADFRRRYNVPEPRSTS